jgi:hypothetical protein
MGATYEEEGGERHVDCKRTYEGKEVGKSVGAYVGNFRCEGLGVWGYMCRVCACVMVSDGVMVCVLCVHRRCLFPLYVEHGRTCSCT